jgi:hypothetical protein
MVTYFSCMWFQKTLKIYIYNIDDHQTLPTNFSPPNQWTFQMYDKTREIWLYMCIYGENVKISNEKVYNLILTEALKPVVYMICNMKPYHINYLLHGSPRVITLEPRFKVCNISYLYVHMDIWIWHSNVLPPYMYWNKLSGILVKSTPNKCYR